MTTHFVSIHGVRLAPPWYAAQTPPPLRPPIYTFQPGSRNPWSTYVANTDEMERKKISRAFRTAWAWSTPERAHQHGPHTVCMTSNC